MGAWSNEVTIIVEQPSAPSPPSPPRQAPARQGPGKRPSPAALVALGVIAALFAYLEKKRGR